ncbi:MAG: invertase [Alphaproteobacteria bacterium]|nr:invertase [Alphaproteobacteria bacterium]
MKNIAYIRVSSDKQNCSNQIFTIKEYANTQNIKINQWVEETISSKKSLEERRLGNLLNSLSSKDCIIITEVSRLVRNLYELAGILQSAIKKDVKIISIKENYVFQNDLRSKIMAYTFELAAEIERDLISTRTRMSLEKLKMQNVKLGRPVGAKSKELKLSKNKKKIKELLENGISQAKIAKIMKVSPTTLCRFLKNTDV